MSEQTKDGKTVFVFWVATFKNWKNVLAKYNIIRSLVFGVVWCPIWQCPGGGSGVGWSLVLLSSPTTRVPNALPWHKKECVQQLFKCHLTWHSMNNETAQSILKQTTIVVFAFLFSGRTGVKACMEVYQLWAYCANGWQCAAKPFSHIPPYEI